MESGFSSSPQLNPVLLNPGPRIRLPGTNPCVVEPSRELYRGCSQSFVGGANAVCAQVACKTLPRYPLQSEFCALIARLVQLVAVRRSPCPQPTAGAR